ncbi:MAG: hypothetical protein M1825_006411 [Sarcosagium campestre]|nr:MAG: hypothetical protein M1825_006411 [Sarcosagium campestre]
MSRSRASEAVLSNPTSESSSASSPERADYEDTDFFTAQANDSQSSIGVTTFREMAVTPSREREQYISPVSRLPAELLIAIFTKLSATSDLRNCLLVSRTWAKYSVDLLWHRPLCNTWDNLRGVIRSVRKPDPFFAYYDLVKRLNLSSLSKDVSDGTIIPLSECKRIERLTLTNCTKLTDSGVTSLLNGNKYLLALDISGLTSVSDHTLLTVANNCTRLQGLNISGCKLVTDKSLTAVSRNCKSIKRLKLNDCREVTDESVISFANTCRQMLEIDLHECREINDVSVTALLARGFNLRELRLAHCSRITDGAFLALPQERQFESLRILDLTACENLTDSAVTRIVGAAPRLRNLVLAKCKKITDLAVLAITKLGKNLHYVHLGHCAHITDTAVMELVKTCNRIRYIDLACCHNLTDQSIMQLATLPKLRRIGLVKCQAITDRSIIALAKLRPSPNGLLGTPSLERVHLSYCVHLTLRGIHALLANCPRLTHLSLTGVQEFLREELTVFCREAPAEFTDHQREVFCVFSGAGVKDLRHHLNHDQELRDSLAREQATFPPDADGSFIYEDGDDAAQDDDEQQVAGLMGATAIHGDAGTVVVDMDDEVADESEIGG